MIIYKATNLLNNKVYIGQTIRILELRKICHENSKDSKMLICKAIQKHGKENFSWIQIDSASSKEELSSKEIFWIRTYMSTNRQFGYNITIGGESSDVFTNNPNINIIKKI